MLLNGNDYDGITAVLDSSTVKSTLDAGSFFPVTLNFFTDEDCADSAEYIIQFSSIEGATATATVKLNMRPGVPKLYADQKAITAAANPGSTITKTVTVTNKGIATMRNIVVENGSLGFIKAEQPEKTTLAPGESLSFNIIMAPTASVQYGKYQDTVTVTNSVVSLAIPVGLEVTALEYGSVQFKVRDDFGENVSGAVITLYGRDPYTQYINGKETTYYLNYSLTTDENGTASLFDKPIGAYDYTVSAKGKQTLTGEMNIMPMTRPAYEEIVLETVPVEISWTVTETTIVDEYEIELTVDLGVKIPEPKLGSSMPWFTIAKNMQSAALLETKIVNHSLIDVIDAVAVIDGNVSGISVVGGGYIGTIPAMSSVTVQLLVQPGYYDLPTFANGEAGANKALLRVTGSYVSYDEDTLLPVYPPKTTQIKVPIYNPGKQKVNMEVVIGDGEKQQMEINMPDDSSFEEMDYFIYQEETGGRIKDKETSSGGVYELVKLSLSQTASLERQAFDAELKITNNYPNADLDSLTTEVVIQYTDPVTKEVSYITDNVYIIQTQGASVSAVASGSTYTGKWKIIPGVGMGGEAGRTYQVFARISYMVNGKLVTTTTDAVEINVKPQPRLKVDYYLPHKIYPNASFRLGVSVTNEGSGTAKNVILDSSQLDIVSNTSGLHSVWEIVSSSFGSYNTSSFRLVLGDIPGVNNGLADDGSDLPNMVWGYFTILWTIPELEEGYLKDVYGEIRNFTATITHKPYEGVELDSLIDEVNTHIVARDGVQILNDTSGEYVDTMQVIVGANGLPEYIRDSATNVNVNIFVPEGLSGGKSGENAYTFTAPVEAADRTDENAPLRYQILMLGESDDFADMNIAAVYRYESADFTGEPISLSFANYWKDTYTVDGEEKNLLYVADEIHRGENGSILPRFYKVVYGSATTLKELKTSKITYLEKFNRLERTAVFYDTGKFHDEDDSVPLGVQATVYNSGKTPESVMVYLFRAPVVSGKTGSFTLVDKKSVTVNSYNEQLVYFYIDLYANVKMPAGVYEFRVGTSANPEDYALNAQTVINALPTANAGVDFNAVVNKTVIFDGSRSYDPDGQIKSFVWDFGDGSSGWGIAPTHIYTASGTYIATLTGTDDNGTAIALITKGYNAEDLPTDSYAIHNVMVTVNDDRPDLIIVPDVLTTEIGKGLEITIDNAPVSNTNTADKGEEIVIFARVMNDKPENPIPSTFIVSLYRDDVYLGYQRITSVYEKTYTIGGETRTVQCADVQFTDIAADNASHVYTVRANDVSIAFDEADMFNNQRSAIVYGASGRTVFPNVGITAVSFEGKPLVNGAVATKSLSIPSGKAISFTVTLQNAGNDATGEFPLTARVNGKWAASENVSSIEPGQTTTVTLSFVPEEGSSQLITFTADGPYPRTLDSDRSDNTWTYNAGTITFEKADLTVENVTVSASGSDAVITAIVTNTGAAAAENSSTVTFYADERYLGAVLTGSFKAGESKEVQFVWKDYEAANRITAVCDAMSVVDETDELNNTFTETNHEGNVLESRAMPALVITKMSTSGSAAFGAEMTTVVTVKNSGAAESAGAFKVSLFAQGVLVGEAVIDRAILPGASAEAAVYWTANVLPTGEYALTALADSEYNIVMSSRSGVRYDSTVSISDGISVAIESDAAYLTQNSDNTVRVRLTRSDGKANTDAAEVKVMVAGTNILSTAVYDSSTDRYLAQLDLSAALLGRHSLVATADLNGLTDACSFTSTVVPSISVTLETDSQVYQAGDAVIVSGAVEGLNSGDTIELSLIGDQIWKYTTVLSNSGTFVRSIELPANAGGAMRIAATVKNAGANRTASESIYVYGAYFASINEVTVTAGDKTTVKGAAENIGYLDLRNVTLTAAANSLEAQNAKTPVIKFMSGGHAYVLDEKHVDLLEAITDGVSVNGKGIDYNALDYRLQIDADGCLPGDYEVLLTLNAMTDKGAYTLTKRIALTLAVPKAVMAITNLNRDNESEENMLAVKTSAAPGEVKTFSYRVVNLGTGNLTGLKAELLDNNGCSVPWASLVMAGGVPSEDALTTTVYPYYRGYDICTAEGAAQISVTFAPQENVTASKYDLTLSISADGVDTVKIPVTVYVSAHAIGTKVIKVVTADGTVITDGKVTLYGPVASAYSVQPVDPKSYSGDISSAVTVGSNLSTGGTVQFTNIPSGTYNVSVSGNGIKAVTKQIEVLPVIDPVPESIIVEQQLFVIRSTASSEKTLESYTVKNGAYDDNMYQLAFGGAYESEKPDLLPDYPVDEIEIAYYNGKISSRLAIMNSDLTEGNELHNVTDVTIKINPRDIASQYIKFKSGEGLTDSLYVGTLAPQETFDFIWNLDLAALYLEAAVEQDGVNYTLTLPEGYSWDTYYAAWERENTRLNAYGYLTKKLYNKVSVTGDGRVLTVTPACEDTGAPDGRVPLYTGNVPKLYKFDIVIEGKSALEFAEGSLSEMKTITRTIPVQVDFIPNGYYLDEGCDSVYTTERLEGAFSTGSNANAKVYSKKFLNSSGATVSTGSTQSSPKNDGFNIGFKQDMVMSGEHSRLTVGFENPSSVESIEELSFKVIISDMMPDENGQIAPGAALKNAEFYVSPSIEKAVGVKGWEGLSEQQILAKFATSNGIDVGTLLANGSFGLVFDLEPLSQLYSNDMFTYLIDSGYMTAEEANRIAGQLREAAGTSYAWVEYSFKRDGRTYTGSTEPVIQNVELPANITSYQEVFQLDEESGVFYIVTVLTNSGLGASGEIRMSAPDIPSLNGDRYRLTSYATGSMNDFPGGDATADELVGWYVSWEDDAVPEEIVIDSIGAGESIYIICRGTRIGHTDPERPENLKPHPIELPKNNNQKIDFKPTIKINGKPVENCNTDGHEDNTADPSQIAALLDEISESLAIMMYSTVADFGTRVEDAYTNAKQMQVAKVIVGVQKYLTYIGTVTASLLDLAGGHLTEKPELPDGDDDDDNGESSLVDQFFSGTLLLGAFFDATDGIIGSIQPFKGAIKTGIAKKSQVEGILRQLDGFGSLVPQKRVNAELTASLAALDGKIQSLSGFVRSILSVYDELLAEAGVSVVDLPAAEAKLNRLVGDWVSVNAEIMAQYTDAFTTVHALYMKAVTDQVGDDANYYNYNNVQKRLLKMSDILTGFAKAIANLDLTVGLVKGHIMLNHHLRGDYEKDFDKYLKDHKLDVPWEAVKAAYENEDINDNYLAKIFPKTADGIGKVKDVYEAKESFRSLKDKVQNFSSALGTASTQGSAAVLAVLSNEGVELMKEFGELEKVAEFIENTLQLIQLANEKDEMTKAMGAFGNATLKLNFHTYEAVRNDFTTGALTKDSPLIQNLMTLVSEAIIKSNQDAPGAFKKMTASDKAEIADYLVKYLNTQRAKYERDERTDSHWMVAHVSGVMAALFEQVYVAAITEQATPEKFLEFMQNADKPKPLGSYLDTTLEKKIFRDVRKEAAAKIESAKSIVVHYSDKIIKNSSYPAKQLITYLEELSQKLQASANIDMLSTRRYKDLTLWTVRTESGTELNIDKNFTMSFRDYIKAMLNTDVINAENSMVVVDYYTAALYDLIVRSALMVTILSPNAISASLGASAAATWDDLADQVFSKLDDVWKQRSLLTAMSIAELALTMGSTVMKEAKIADMIYDLIAALDRAVVFDPPLNTELITYSIKDVVIPDGEAKGTGEVLVTFRNDGEKTVAVSPSVSIYTSAGMVAAANFDSSSILIPAGQSADFIGTFSVSRSVLLDSTGYSAVLTYAASEPETVSIAAEQGPFVRHFYAGTERQIAAMRSKVSAGTIVSGWVTGAQTLTGSVTVKEGQNLRIFAATPVNSKLSVEILSPSGAVIEAQSFINAGDYAMIPGCEAGEYTVRVTTPEGFDGRITAEGVVSSFDKAITAVHTEKQTVVSNNNRADDGSYLGNLSVSVSESAGIAAGVIQAELSFADENLSATPIGFGGFTLNAGGALNGGFVIKANPNTPAGVYTGTLKISFDAAACDPVFLSLLSTGDDAAGWTTEDGKVVYTAQVQVTVDVTAPAAPEISISDGKREGTLTVTGTAPGAVYIILTYENDFTEENDDGIEETYTSKVIAAICNPNPDGSFAITLSKPAQNARLSAVAVNIAGGLSAAATQTVEGYTKAKTESEKFAESFTAVKAEQIEGKRDVSVTVYGAQSMGLSLTGDIYYRVVENAPEGNFPADNFDSAGWTNAGAASSFTVKNVQNGQHIEIVQAMREADGAFTVVRHSSAAIEMTDVQGCTVFGQLTPDDVKADMAGAVLVLTDASDSSVTYTAVVEVTDGAASYTFTDVLSGTYILSLDPSVIKISADNVLLTVDSADKVKNIDVNRVILPGDINSDYQVDNKDLTRLFQYLTDWNVEVESKTLDVNGDGEVNNKDLTRLYQYLSGWEVEIY